MSLRDEIVAAIYAAPADNPMWMDAAADALMPAPRLAAYRAAMESEE